MVVVGLVAVLLVAVVGLVAVLLVALLVMVAVLVVAVVGISRAENGPIARRSPWRMGASHRRRR